MLKKKKYPDAVDPHKVGNYPASVYSGGGYFYDDVLEYRVWVKNPRKVPVFYSFTNYDDASKFSHETINTEEPVVLVLQKEHIDEPSPGNFILKKGVRLAEWSPEWLEDSKNTGDNVRLFLQKKV